MNHDWTLIKAQRSAFRGDHDYVWKCNNCNEIVRPTEKQASHKTFRKPNPKRKFGGLHCGQLVAKFIHEA